jgi:CubicO group peptidase (beta-lactamase class C family)
MPSDGPEIFGHAPGKLGVVKDVFASQFTHAPDGLNERGARFTAVVNGEVILDLWGGTCDREGQVAFTDNTLAPIFSSGKAIMALMIARLVDQGKLDYEAPISALWPEFGQNGKAGITLGQFISHQGGLPGFKPPIEPATWFDIPATLKAICAQTPLWTPGEGSGYHPVIGGYVLGEVFRRADGRTMGTAFREDLSGPFGLDIFIGTPDSEFSRITEIQKPSAPPNLGAIDDIKRAAFFDRGSSPGGGASADWRRLEVPSANTHATAKSLAELMGVVATGGWLNGQRVLSLNALAQASRERVSGQDRVLPYRLSWAAGFLRNKGIKIYGPNERALGHSGWGGSCVFADPDKRLSVAYVMNRQSPYLFGDPRALKLIEALYSAI